MTSPIIRHPDITTLMSFAAGALSEPLAAVVSAHIHLCPQCHREWRRMEALGGELLLASGAPAHDDPLPVPPMPTDRPVPKLERRMRSAGPMLPAPLVARYGLDLAAVPWKWMAAGVSHYPLALSKDSVGELRLIKVAPGYAIPDHGHGGAELTLVLQGAYDDITGRYQRGDCQEADRETEHRPIADHKVGCICLVASETPPAFKGVIARLLYPLISR